ATTLRKQRRFRAIEILGRVFRARHHASAKSNDATAFVANRKHQAIAKRVVISRPLLPLLHQPADQKLLWRKFSADLASQKSVPPIGRKADLEAANRLLIEAALGEIFPRRFAGWL